MAKLYLKFEQAVLKEYPLAQGEATIGRLPDNLIQVDNLAVSGHHARIYWETDHYALEDNQSLNGTYLNRRRVAKAVLRDNDEILIGKHTVVFKAGAGAEVQEPGLQPSSSTRPVLPSLDSTVVLDSKKVKEVMARGQSPVASSAAPGSVTVASASPRERLGILTIMDGKTDQGQYVLSGKLSVIGKSSMASIRLKGWFAPKVAAVINRRDDKYQIAPSEKKSGIRVNGDPIQGQQELSEGDVIEVAGIKATFAYSD